MNKAVISKEAILTASKEIVAQKGINAINMRDIASRCGVAVGSVYNYFPSKEDLIVATIASIWIEIMNEATVYEPGQSFCESVMSLYTCVKNENEKYPYFIGVHSGSLEKSKRSKARKAMNEYFGMIKAELLKSLCNDKNVNNAFFSEKCTKESFVDFVFSNIIALLIKQDSNCDTLLEIIKKTIY